MARFNLDQGYGGEAWIKRIAEFLSEGNEVSILSSSLGPRNVHFVSELRENNSVQVTELSAEDQKRISGDPIRHLGNFDTIYVLDSPFNRSQTRNFLEKYPMSLRIKGNHTPLDIDTNSPKLRLHVRMYYRFLKPFLMKPYSTCDVNHVLNKCDERKLKAHGIPTTLVYNGVDLASYAIQKKYSQFTLTLLGRLSFEKGIDRVGDLLEHLEIPADRFKVIVMGDGPLSDRLKTLDCDNLEVRGYVKIEERNEVLARSHSLVVLSRQEVFPFNVVESLASGTPVISFDICGIRDIVKNGHNGFLAKSMQEMCSHIRTLYEMSNTQDYDRMSQAARESVTSFDWNLKLSELMKMFSSQLTSRRTGGAD